MTTRELIIGHFNGTISVQEQQSLDQILSGSAEARALFEQHKLIHSELESDAERIVPAFWLQTAALESALGVATQTIGSTVGFWSVSKIVAVIVTTVISGTGATYLLNRADADKHQAPAQSTVPAAIPAQQNNAPPAATPAPVVEKPVLKETTESPAVVPGQTPREAPVSSHTAMKGGKSHRTPPEGNLLLDKDPQVRVDKGTRVGGVKDN